MAFLLDTCVLSEPRKPQPDAGVLSWLEACDPDELFISAISLGELAQGIALLEDGRRKRGFTDWLNKELLPSFGARVITLDATVAQVWGNIAARARRAGRSSATADAQIAACALAHGMTLVTCNVPHFHAFGVKLLNPWT